MNTGIILYGPPASGKDTVTHALNHLSPAYVQFQRLKVGPGRTTGYRMATPAQLDDLRAADLVLYENQRYEATYVVDQPHLADLVSAGTVPVIHLGQIAGIHAVRRYSLRWITVLLWCSRPTSADRLLNRGATDLDVRLGVWDETLADLKQASATDFSHRIDTEVIRPDEAATVINALVSMESDPTQPQRSSL
ncbi:MAG: guanylate kinase [Streptomyces sp.]|nr:guanylate kinase [Streptomyces sp.]